MSGYNENMNNNPMLKLFKGVNLYQLEEEWNNWIDQSTIEVVSQSIAVNIHTQEIVIAMWYKWVR